MNGFYQNFYTNWNLKRYSWSWCMTTDILSVFFVPGIMLHLVECACCWFTATMMISVFMSLKSIWEPQIACFYIMIAPVAHVVDYISFIHEYVNLNILYDKNEPTAFFDTAFYFVIVVVYCFFPGGLRGFAKSVLHICIKCWLMHAYMHRRHHHHCRHRWSAGYVRTIYNTIWKPPSKWCK